MNIEERRALYERIKASGRKPLECHICHNLLAGKGSNFFCPECRFIVSHESKWQTQARKEFFRYLDDYDEQSGKSLNCQRDELVTRERA